MRGVGEKVGGHQRDVLRNGHIGGVVSNRFPQKKFVMDNHFEKPDMNAAAGSMRIEDQTPRKEEVKMEFTARAPQQVMAVLGLDTQCHEGGREPEVVSDCGSGLEKTTDRKSSWLRQRSGGNRYGGGKKAPGCCPPEPCKPGTVEKIIEMRSVAQLEKKGPENLKWGWCRQTWGPEGHTLRAREC